MIRLLQANRICIAITILCGNIVFSGASLAKCCPGDSRLNIVDATIKSCVKSENVTSDWDSYNVAISSNGTQFPHCEYSVQRAFEAPVDFAELNGCLDKRIDGQFYAFHCNGQPATAVHKLNKCCPLNHSYDHTERFCVPNTDSILHFNGLFRDNVVIFEPKVPDCDDGEAFVEYYSTAHDIEFVDRNLKITTEHFPKGEVLPSEKYCVEGLVNAAVEQTQRHLIVRSCRPRDICNRIPCIRRCCKSDQMYQRNPVTKKSECVAHPSSANFMPVFYDINFPLEPNKSQDQIHLKGMTMVFRQKNSPYDRLALI